MIQAQSQMVHPIPASYVPFEDQSFWMRRRALIWTLIILFSLGVGLVTIILPGFAISC